MLHVRAKLSFVSGGDNLKVKLMIKNSHTKKLLVFIELKQFRRIIYKAHLGTQSLIKSVIQNSLHGAQLEVNRVRNRPGKTWLASRRNRGEFIKLTAQIGAKTGRKLKRGTVYFA